MTRYRDALHRELRATDPQTAQEYNAVCAAFDQTLTARWCKVADALIETGTALLVSSKILALKNRVFPKGGPHHS